MGSAIDCESTVVAGFGAVIWDTFTGTFEFVGDSQVVEQAEWWSRQNVGNRGRSESVEISIEGSKDCAFR